MRYLSDQNLKKFQGKTCLLRVDLNIEKGKEKNNLRLESIVPTIKLLLENNIKIIILSHRGRINFNSQIKNQKLKLTLSHLSLLISQKIKQPVIFIPRFDFKKLKKQIQNSKNQVWLLENLRFLKGETKNDSKLARQLASLGDFYINDAFSVCHRWHASVVAITKYLPAYAGLLLEKEIKHLNRVIKNYRRPMAIIMGGAKISDKIEVIKHFWRSADYFLLGGGPANTFFAAQGLPVGNSLIDKNSELKIKNYINSKKIILPSDVKIYHRQILDIGEQTIKNYSEIIKKSSTIIWNGPMGFFEKKGFEKGTFSIWKAILANHKAQIVVGGGDTIASLEKFKIQNSKFKIGQNVFISTGGGAMLAYLAGKKLPGMEVLK